MEKVYPACSPVRVGAGFLVNGDKKSMNDKTAKIMQKIYEALELARKNEINGSLTFEVNPMTEEVNITFVEDESA